jgi:peptidyl-tRNA hydrolase, PTH2 family
MGAYKYKQSIIVRADLNMPKGKMAAQVAHASMGAILTYLKSKNEILAKFTEGPRYLYQLDVPAPVHEWLSGDFAKIILKCQTVDELLELEEKAKVQGIPYKLIIDNGTTVFNEPTVTCIAIGPWRAETIDEMTKDFKLL